MMAAVVLATGISQYLERSVATRVDDIVTNAMPSVQVLSLARLELSHMERDVGRFVRAPAEQRPELQQLIATERHAIDVALASYRSLPYFAGERGLAAPTPALLARVDERVAALTSRGDPATLDPLRDDIIALDDLLEHLVSFDASQGQQLGLSIGKARARSHEFELISDAVIVLLAVGATLLAVRQLRQALSNLVTQRSVAELRASELETKVDELGHFAGRVAHDVLSPLSTAMLSFQIIEQSAQHEPRMKRATRLGVAAVERVHTLVEGLLAFARAGGHPEAGDSTAIAPVIADVVDGLHAQAKAARIELVAESVPVASVACSAGVLTSVLSNLVRNAIRYMGESLERRIVIRVRDAGAARWRVEVQDTGPGIPPGQEQRIFEPYVQLGRANAGIGLGLATVDRLVRAHGGRVGVSSPPGHGCLFWFELPAAA